MNYLKMGCCLFILSVTTGTFAEVNPPSMDCGVAGLSSCPTPVDPTLPDVKNMLTWNQQQRVIGFRNDYRSYPGDVFKAAQGVALPVKKQDLSSSYYQYNGNKYLLKDYILRNNVTGLLVIKNGEIVFEYYGAGNTPTTLWTSRSVGKSVVSTLVGIALNEGTISSLDDELIKYNPSVKETAWEHITLRQLLHHTSGITWVEDYTNPKSDFSLLTECEANQNTYDCVAELVLNADRKAYAKPGEVWSYSSGGAWLLGDTLEKATNQPLAHYLQEKIWQPYGMLHDGVWHSYLLDKHDVGAHGFNATLVDWGKFGLFVMNNGILPDGTKQLPDDWVNQAKTWITAKNSVTAAHPEGSYGFEWWNNSVPQNAKNVSPKQGLTSSDSMWAQGIYGQLIMVNQKEKLVIVQWSTWPDAEPANDKQPLEASLMFNAIANKVKSLK